MKLLNREAYRAAQEHINSGRWVVDVDSGLILNWKGTIGYPRNGYLGLTTRNHPSVLRAFVHRVIWEHVHGDIADGLEVNHINGVKTDNRLANLELVTSAGNTRHAIDAGLHKITPRKLSAKHEDEVRLLYATGVSQCQLAARFGVSQKTISTTVTVRCAA